MYSRESVGPSLMEPLQTPALSGHSYEDVLLCF